MTRIKRNIFLGALTIAVLIASLCIGLANTGNKEAMAATTPKYLLNGTINYVAKLAYGAGYNKTAKYNSISNMGDYLAVELYSNSYSGSATAEEGIWFNFSYVKIVANVKQSKSPHNQNCSFGHTSFELKNLDTGSVIKSSSLSGTGERTLIAQSLSDGHYSLTYVAGGAITGVTSGSITDTFTFDFYLDATAPTISGASTSTTGKYTNSAFTVSASDSYSGVQNLYMKAPGATSYSAVSTSKTVAAGSTNGLYSFYAKDKQGNTSATYYVYYDTVLPTGAVKNSSGTVLTTSSTNGAFSFVATDTGSGVSYCQYKTPGASSWLSYTSGTTISATATNGLYQFRAVDKAGNVSDVKSIYLDTVRPTGTLYGGTSIIASGGRTNASYVKFVPIDGLSGVKYIYVRMPSSLGYESYTSGSQLAEKGTYNFYCVDGAGNSSTVYTITLDKSAPILGCLQTEFYSTYGLGFTVSASDDSGNVNLYYKTPSSSSYVLSGTSSYSTTLESENGKYYFYAVDDLGNTSQTYWIELEVVYPDPTVIHSETDNSVYITWTNGKTATLNGNDYTKGTWITTEGSYTVTVTNEYGLSTTKSFSITHNYVVVQVIEPTCTTNGYSIFKCTSCGGNYMGNVKLATGHNYNVETIEATCTTYGCIKYTCLNCGDTYETDKETALGHKYTETTKEATCTEDGGQLHTCTVCGYEYLTDTVKATGHDYSTSVVREPHCETEGERIFHCEKCSDEYYTEIPATGHNFELYETNVVDGENIRTYVCTNCGEVTTQNMGEQYEKVSSYVEYLFEQYQPYMWWTLLATAGVWSIVMGVFFGIAAKNEDKEKSRKMIKNYVIGLVVIAVILVACPYLVKGIAALITG